MILEDLEEAFRERQRLAGTRLVIVAMQIPETDLKTLRPRLERRGESLSEHVRKLIRQNVTWENH